MTNNEINYDEMLMNLLANVVTINIFLSAKYGEEGVSMLEEIEKNVLASLRGEQPTEEPEGDA